MKYCTQCRHDGEKVGADWYITGTRHDADRPTPYRGFLCGDHMSMFLEEGFNPKKQTAISKKAKLMEANDLTRELTTYPSFQKLCFDNPTLRTPQRCSLHYVIKMDRLRAYYKEFTSQELPNKKG